MLQRSNPDRHTLDVEAVVSAATSANAMRELQVGGRIMLFPQQRASGRDQELDKLHTNELGNVIKNYVEKNKGGTAYQLEQNLHLAADSPTARRAQAGANGDFLISPLRT
ncbi:unnamed protein product, partial [Amoebophrya sp. A25]|eukprot:GSA25T00013825001.1